LINQLHGTDLLEELVCPQLVKKFLACDGTQKFIIAFKRASTCPYPDPNQSRPCPPPPSHFFKIYFNTIIPSTLGASKECFLTRVLNNILYFCLQHYPFEFYRKHKVFSVRYKMNLHIQGLTFITFFSKHFGFPLSTTLHQCSILNFIHTLNLPEGQAGQRNLSKSNAFLEMVQHWVNKITFTLNRLLEHGNFIA